MIQNGAISIQNNEKNTPIDFAGMCGFLEVVKLFFMEFNNRAQKNLDEVKKKILIERKNNPIFRPQK